MRKQTTSLFDWGKTNVCVQRCDDTTLVQVSSPLEVTTEDFDAQTAAFCGLTAMAEACNAKFLRRIYSYFGQNKQQLFPLSLFSCWRRGAGEAQQRVEEGLDVSRFSYVTAS